MNDPLSIRKATERDIRRISYLIRGNTEKLSVNRYSKAQIETWKKANTPAAIKKQMDNRILFCAFRGKQLVGTIGLENKMVVGLYIAYNRMGKGIASQLLQYLENYAQQQNIQQLTLLATPSGKRFYQKHGYLARAEQITMVNEVAFPETFMEKQLLTRSE